MLLPIGDRAQVQHLWDTFFLRNRDTKEWNKFWSQNAWKINNWIGVKTKCFFKNSVCLHCWINIVFQPNGVLINHCWTFSTNLPRWQIKSWILHSENWFNFWSFYRVLTIQPKRANIHLNIKKKQSIIKTAFCLKCIQAQKFPHQDHSWENTHLLPTIIPDENNEFSLKRLPHNICGN